MNCTKFYENDEKEKENERRFSREGKQRRRRERDKDPRRVGRREGETSYTKGMRSGLPMCAYSHHTTRRTLRNTPKGNTGQLWNCWS